MELSQALHARRSIRKFQNRYLTDTQIVSLLEAARLSPSAKNLQPWKYIILRGEDLQKAADMIDKAFLNSSQTQNATVPETCRAIRSAAVVFLVSCRLQTENTAAVMMSLGASMENVCLKAVDMGLGSLWICDLDIAAEELRETFCPENPVVAALAVGYPAEHPDQRPRLPVEAISDWTPREKRSNINSLSKNITSDKFIFVSYSHVDKLLVEADVAELKRHGVPVWIDDSMVAGVEWNRIALQRIRDPNCVGVVFYLSESSMLSESVAEELQATLEKFGQPKVYDTLSTEPARGYFSVNIGGEPPAAVYSRLFNGGMPADPAKQAVVQKFTEAFSSSKIFINRSPALLDCSHIEEMLRMFALYDVITPGVYDTFTYEVTAPDQVRITGFFGDTPVVTVVDRISGIDVTEIGNNAFCGNRNLRSVYIPDKIRSIGDGVFLGLQNLSDVRLPETMDRIGVAAFRNTPNLKTVRLPRGLKILEEAAFRDSGIVEIEIPQGVERLGEAVFMGCAALKRVVIPDSVTEMTEGGFKKCFSLEKIRLPEHIRGLNRDSFSDCPKVDVFTSQYHYHDGTADPIDK